MHLICNSKGELCAFHITPSHCDDRKPVDSMTKDMLGKLFADKGYIDKKLNKILLERGLRLITPIRKKMKNKLMPLIDKILLRKRSIIKSTNNQLKFDFHLEHHRYLSSTNGFTNMLAACIAYALQLGAVDIQLLGNA